MTSSEFRLLILFINPAGDLRRRFLRHTFFISRPFTDLFSSRTTVHQTATSSQILPRRLSAQQACQQKVHRRLQPEGKQEEEEAEEENRQSETGEEEENAGKRP